MKKLMIAAACAAMIGSAFAGNYDFTATVKTTKGKQGKQTTTYKVNLGQDADGNYWWKDDYESAAAAKKALAKWTNEAKQEYAENVIAFGDPQWDDDPLNIGKNEFGIPEWYNGKALWCATFTYKVTDANCYRVAASRKFKGIVQISDDCCAESIEFLYTTSLAKDPNMEDFLGECDDDVEIETKLLYAIGGVSAAKSTKVEYVAQVGTFGDKFGWALAGQGALKDGVIKNISGNIVGILENPDCENCCDNDQLAIVFECTDSWELLEDPEGTAAFGTWSFKYNSKLN